MKAIKQTYKLFISSVICVAFLITGIFFVVDVNANGTRVTYSEYNSTYKGGKETPTSSDAEKTLFAGWYKDEEFTTPVKESETLADSTEQYVYPKFVDPNVMTVKLQITANLDPATDTTTDIRLITGADSANYQNVYFTVTGNNTVTYTCKKEAYTSITGTVYGSSTEYNPANTFGTTDANYFITHYLSGAELTMNTADTDGVAYNNDNFGTTITVVPSWETLDGTVVTGTARQFEINDGLYPVEIDALTGEGETDHVWYSSLDAAVTAANASTKEGAVTIGLLDDLSLDSTIAMTRNINIRNKTDDEITINRLSDSFLTSMFVSKTAGTTITIGNDAGAGQLVIDADTGTTLATEPAIDNAATLTLYENVTVKNAKASTAGKTCPGGLRTSGRTDVYADFINCEGGLGGAIQITGDYTRFIDGTIEDCTAYRGGGAYTDNAKFLMRNSKITGCKATNMGGGVYQGGTIPTTTGYTDGFLFEATATISGCESLHGGGVRTVKGTIAGNIENCTATAGYGGGIIHYTSTLSFSGTIKNCTANTAGNAIEQQGGTINLNSGTIDVTPEKAITAYGASTAQSTLNIGGCTLPKDTNLTDDNCVIDFNSAKAGKLSINGSANMTDVTIYIRQLDGSASPDYKIGVNPGLFNQTEKLYIYAKTGLNGELMYFGGSYDANDYLEKIVSINSTNIEFTASGEGNGTSIMCGPVSTTE